MQQGDLARQQGGHGQSRVGLGQLDIVHLSQHLAFDIQKLSVEKLQGPVDLAVELVRHLRGHWPNLVQIRSGMAATAATRISPRNTTPSAFASRPLVWSPM